MQYSIFTIPIRTPEEGIQELNKFLVSHRVLQVEKTLITDNSAAFYVFAVTWEEKSNKSFSGKNTVDYKEILNDEDFAVYSKLREIRKKCSEQFGRPVYAVFTNEQLASMVLTKVSNPADMKKIDGIGEGKIKDYASIFVEYLKTVFSEE